MTFIVRRQAGRNHYYVDLDTDERWPGVTTITKALPKDALINWAAETTARYAVNNWDRLHPMPPADRLKALMGGRWEERDAAANRGTAVHKLADRLAHGERVTVPPELAGHIESYVRFLDEYQVVAQYVEAVVYSEKHRYVGTLDLIADVLLPDMPEYDHIPRDGETGLVRALLDIKTGGSGIYGEAALQLAGYRYCDRLIVSGWDSSKLEDREEVDMPEVDLVAAIHVRADGHDLVPLIATEREHRALLYVREVGRIAEGLRDLVGEPITPPTASTYRLVRDDA